MVPERNGRTDRQTDLLYQYRAAICWRAIKTGMMWLLDGQKSFRICLTDRTEYWRVADGRTSCYNIVRTIIIIIIIITKIMFMVLPLWQSHWESSPGLFDECRIAPNGRRPKTKPDYLGCESACTGCQKLHPPSPFIIVTQPESWYLFYRPT